MENQWKTNIAAPFRCGISCVDIALIDRDCIYLGRKKNQTKFRFFGGFFDAEIDSSLEGAAIRELHEECENVSFDLHSYVGSLKVDDERYAEDKDKIITSLFIAKHKSGTPTAADDIVEIRKFKIKDLGLDSVVEVHHPLLLLLIKYFYFNTGELYD